MIVPSTLIVDCRLFALHCTTRLGSNLGAGLQSTINSRRQAMVQDQFEDRRREPPELNSPGETAVND
jgi:hypothetical protein